MDIDLYADVEDFNDDDAVPNPEEADPKPKSKSSGMDLTVKFSLASILIWAVIHPI